MPLEFRPKIEKILELLVYLAHKKPGVDKYQVVKFFYLADREHLNRYGRPITYESYFALPYGPVASTAMDLVEGERWILKEAGIDMLPFDTEEKPTNKGKLVTTIVGARRDVNFDLFSKSDIRVFDQIIKEYGDYSFEQLYELTHTHLAYKKAWENKKPNVKRAQMYYEDMIDDENKRAAIVEDLGPVAANIE